MLSLDIFLLLDLLFSLLVLVDIPVVIPPDSDFFTSPNMIKLKLRSKPHSYLRQFNTIIMLCTDAHNGG